MRMYSYKDVHINNINTLYNDRIDVSEEIDFNKASVSKQWDICHYWYFLDKGFKFQLYVCSCCPDVLMMSIKVIDIAILNISDANYRCIINGAKL